MRGERWECEAYQISDQMSCDKCGLVWDMNDDDPPECRTGKEIQQDNGAKQLAKIRAGLDLPHISP